MILQISALVSDTRFVFTTLSVAYDSFLIAISCLNVAIAVYKCHFLYYLDYTLEEKSGYNNKMENMVE